MSAIPLDKPRTGARPAEKHPATTPAASTLLERAREPDARTCPVCGSGATYQTMDGRWGCTSCGSTWA
ncbi:transposase [Kitasatospora sp. NPDC003701]